MKVRTPTSASGGYSMVAWDGGVFSSGDADFLGSTGNEAPIVGMAAEPGLTSSPDALAASTSSDTYRVPGRFNDSYRYRQWLQHRAQG